MNFPDARRRLLGGELSCEAIVTEHLDAIRSKKKLNAFLEVYGEESLANAREIDSRVRAGTAGPLAGMVIALKDILCMKDRRVTCGSRILDGFIAPYDATVVRRLADADAVIIGKTNMDEFAMGSSNENSAFGPVLNPADPARVPGGSSGGSAAAVAAGLAMTALGTDTGGSIRQPASLCGVVGMKPTYGRVSRYGLVAFASSFDQIGPIGSTVEETASVLSVIAGHDPCDSTSSDAPVPDYAQSLGRGVSGMKIGIPKEYFPPGLDADVRAAVMTAVESLRKGGATVTEVSLPHSDYLIAAYYILSTAEASSNLARYDGARYGRRADDPADLQDLYLRSRSEGFGAEVKRRIMLGTYVLSSGYYDAYYLKGQKVRRLIREDFDRAFAGVDCLITPTTPTTAFAFGEKIDDPLTMYLSDVFTVSANLAGIPGISVPCGRDGKNLPIGAQVLGKHFDEANLFRVASFIENTTTE